MKTITLREFLRGKTYAIGKDKLVTCGGDVYIHFEHGQLSRPCALESEIILHLDNVFRLSGKNLYLVEDNPIMLKCERNVKIMKATGIIRRVDDLGRIVIPKEVRRRLNIAAGDPLELYLDKNQLIYEKYNACEDVLSAVNSLKIHIVEDIDINCKSELAEKLSEIEALIKKEANNA